MCVAGVIGFPLSPSCPLLGQDLGGGWDWGRERCSSRAVRSTPAAPTAAMTSDLDDLLNLKDPEKAGERERERER